LSADLVGTSLTVHGAVCAGALLGVWKLGGESKFGTDKVADLLNLRPKLLKSLVGSLELYLNPILTASSVTDIEVDANGNAKPMRPKLSVVGKEALTNAVRDFVKADSRGLLALRDAGALDARLNLSLDRLRKLVWFIFAVTGIFCLLMVVAKFEWWDLSATWIHVLALSAVVGMLVGVACLFWRILDASSRVDRLKSEYADLP